MVGASGYCSAVAFQESEVWGTVADYQLRIVHASELQLHQDFPPILGQFSELLSGDTTVGDDSAGHL